MLDTTFTPFPYSEYSFITLTTFQKRNIFIKRKINDIACKCLAHHAENNNVNISGYVIMPDHAHILVRPDELSISRFITVFKTYTGDKVKSAGGFDKKVWRTRFYNVPVEDREHFIKHLEKMHSNPIKNNLCVSLSDYPWSSYSNYQLEISLVPVTIAPVKLQKK